MFPMNWFLFSTMLLLLMSLSFQNSSYSKPSDHKKNLVMLKNMKWKW